MDTHVNSSKREVTSGRVNHDELDGEDLLRSSGTCDGSPKVSISSPLLSPSTTIKIPQGLNSIDVVATFEVPLTTIGDLHKLINDIEAGKHDELLSEMTNDDRMETMDAICVICKTFQADNNNADVIPCKVSHVDDSINRNVDESTIPNDPIVQSVDINTKSTSYVGAAGASAKDQPKVNSNFRTLVADPVYDGINIFIPRKVVKKKWSMDTRLLKEELIHIPIRVKLHDVPIQVFEEDGISLIATFIGKPVMLDSYTSSMCNESWGMSSFARCLIEVNSEAGLVDVVTIGIPSLSRDGFTKETIRVDPPIVGTSNFVTLTVEKINDGFQTVGKKKKRKGKSKSTNGGQFTGSSVKQNVRYQPNATTSAPKKGVTNVGNTSQSTSMLKTTGNSSKKDNLFMSNSFSALNDEEEDDEEDVQNVYDESANLILNTKAGGSSSFMAAAG
ncbi:zinc knuckle CX2CX4HX4C containing protein [Tanacetum coccineum]